MNRRQRRAGRGGNAKATRESAAILARAVELQRNGSLEDAVACYRQAIALKPDVSEVYNNLGCALRDLGRLAEAVDRFRRAIVLKADYAEPHNNLGLALTDLDRHEEAIACFQCAITIAPTLADAHRNLGVALSQCGRLDEAYHAFARALDLVPRWCVCLRMLAETGRLAPTDPIVRRMEDLATEMDSLSAAERMELHFALAAVYADAGWRDRSFPHLLAGNRLKRNAIAYDEATTLARLGRIRGVFTAELLARVPARGPSPPLPVFVVGMPRSGTTLVEQVLASHPQAFGAGELLDLPRMVDALEPVGDGPAFPEGFAVLPSRELDRLGAAYRAGVSARAPSAACIVDKLPGNFMLIGVIRLALPEARIIHVRRDPIDTCLSCFSKLFNGASPPYVYDLAELGRFYRAYDGLMAHWRQALPPEVMLEVDYEELVADLEGQTRRLLDHCRLDWDPRCLDFHRTQRVVRTASHVQVRQPLYASSVGRWQGYGGLARPLLDALQG